MRRIAPVLTLCALAAMAVLLSAPAFAKAPPSLAFALQPAGVTGNQSVELQSGGGSGSTQLGMSPLSCTAVPIPSAELAPPRRRSRRPTRAATRPTPHPAG